MPFEESSLKKKKKKIQTVYKIHTISYKIIVKCIELENIKSDTLSAVTPLCNVFLEHVQVFGILHPMWQYIP